MILNDKNYAGMLYRSINELKNSHYKKIKFTIELLTWRKINENG